MVIETGDSQSPFALRGRAASNSSVLLSFEAGEGVVANGLKKEKKKEQINANLRINLGRLTG